MLFRRFLQKKKYTITRQIPSSTDVLGLPLGAHAGGLDATAIESVYAESTTIPPAGVRPDPDTFVRNVLLQYRSEGLSVARLLSEVEGYRPLLGGASLDFASPPKEDYDATSMLANLKVGEILCTSLIAPEGAGYRDWAGVLPSSADQWDTNIRYLVQRLLGVPSSSIDTALVSELKGVLDTFATSGSYRAEDYVAVCTALLTDARALHF